MIKISEAIKEIVEKNPNVKFSLFHGFINLTQFAAFIKPTVEARVKKEVQVSALVMALSRLQKKLEVVGEWQNNFKVKSLNIASGLAVVAFEKNDLIHEKISLFYKKVRREESKISLTEGNSEITLIFEQNFRALLSKMIEDNPLEDLQDISSISLKFDLEYSETPGFLYNVLQRLAFQGVNVIEVSSTFTELIVYVKSGEASLAFDTLYNSFL